MKVRSYLYAVAVIFCHIKLFRLIAHLIHYNNLWSIFIIFAAIFLKAECHINEEVLEKRIEILTNSVRKSRRRKRTSATEIFEDSEDEHVPSVSLSPGTDES